MNLIPVDPEDLNHVRWLYDLLQARPDIANVSHKKMPSKAMHHLFVRNHPYADWSFIVNDDDHIVGSVFLSQPARPSVVGDEVSVDIFPEHRGQGYAEQALTMLMEKHGPRRYIANVAIGNDASKALFDKLGFKHIQNTLERIVPEYTPQRVDHDPA